jgi:Ca2+-binding EF-hand superfamily protein
MAVRLISFAIISVQELEEVTEAFQLFDTEQKGSIDVKEIKAAFRALGFQVRILRFARYSMRCLDTSTSISKTRRPKI